MFSEVSMGFGFPGTRLCLGWSVIGIWEHEDPGEAAD